MTDPSEHAPNGNGGSVKYSTREMFDKIDATLIRMESKLDAKAEAADLLAVATRVSVLEEGDRTRAATAAALVAAAKTREDSKTRRTTVGLSALGTLGIILAVVLPLTIH